MLDKLLKLNLQHFAEDSAEDQTSENQSEEKGTDSQQSEEKTFTQDDVNNLIARETKKQQEKFLKQLGVEDFKDAKEGMTKLKEFQDAQKTDQEKQQEQLQDLEKQNETLTTEKQSLEAQVSAMKQGVLSDSVEDVVALAERMVDENITIDEAIKKVVEKYPHFSAEQEQEQQEEPQKPSFTTGQHQKQSGSNDPFLAKIAKYKK